MAKRLALLLFVAALLAVVFALDLHHWLSFQRLQQSQAAFQAQFEQSPWLIAAAFFGIYFVVTALSLPGAAIMTLASGALFGLVLGTVLASFASTLGATCAFLVARYALRDAVQARFQKKGGERLAAINRGFEREGAFYLFTLRLVPLFPFFLINLLMALSPIRARTFYWVSQIGMLPGTVVYVLAGTQLAQVDGPSDVLSPGLLASFVLLGLFPLFCKRLVTALERRKGQRAVVGNQQ